MMVSSYGHLDLPHVRQGSKSGIDLGPVLPDLAPCLPWSKRKCPLDDIINAESLKIFCISVDLWVQNSKKDFQPCWTYSNVYFTSNITLRGSTSFPIWPLALPTPLPLVCFVPNFLCQEICSKRLNLNCVKKQGEWEIGWVRYLVLSGMFINYNWIFPQVRNCVTSGVFLWPTDLKITNGNTVEWSVVRAAFLLYQQKQELKGFKLVKLQIISEI